MPSPKSFSGASETPSIDGLLSYYSKELASSFSLVESLAGEDGIPIQFYMEIRAATTHIGRVCEMSETDKSSLSDEDVSKLEKEIADNLHKAKRHLRRFHLDCQKWCCAYFEDKTTSKITELTQACALRLVDDGKYLGKARDLEQKARELHSLAKQEDSQGTDHVLARYVEAEIMYEKLYDHLFFPTEETRQRIAELIERRRRNTCRDIAWAAAGFAVALAGLVCNFI